MEIHREAALPLTAYEALPQTSEIASTEVLTVEELAVRPGISGDEARDLIDRLGTDRAAVEQAARDFKEKRRGKF
jgi:DNA-binding MarR family transcriptional regulator